MQIYKHKQRKWEGDGRIQGNGRNTMTKKRSCKAFYDNLVNLTFESLALVSTVVAVALREVARI